MKSKSTTYRFLTKAVATLLLTALLLPIGLQAKQLMDFCMKEMSHQEMIMDDSHNCCSPVTGHHHSDKQKKSHNCKSGQICTCTFDKVPAQNQSVVPANFTAGIILSQTGFNFTVTPPHEIIYKDFSRASNRYTPPLYLLHESFLN